MPNRDQSVAERNGYAEPEPTELIDPLVEAEQLRNALAEAAQRAVRLLAGLKQFGPGSNYRITSTDSIAS